MSAGSESLAARIAFAGYRNITLGAAERLEALGAGPEEFFALDGATLSRITGLKETYFESSRREAALAQGRREAAYVEANNIKAIYHSDADFPRRLRDCSDGPAMVYALGTWRPDHRYCIAVVGTRHATAYGSDFTRRLVEDLSSALDDVLIISGLAYGIDICAHRAALMSGVATGAVLAHGLNTIYPADHRGEAARIVREGGFLLTEYCSSSAVHRGNFLARNRIVAGLADATVVVESDMRGGAMSTARISAAYNRDVFAVPGRVNDSYSRGTNALLAGQQAIMLRDASDLISAMRWKAIEPEGTQQTLDFEPDGDRKAVVDFIRRRPEGTVNDMCVALDVPYARLSPLLFEMEMDDQIVSLPGGRFGLPAKNK